MNKVVASRTGKVADWKTTRVVGDLDLQTVADLRREETSDIVVYGSLSVVAALAELGMVDEHHLLIHRSSSAAAHRFCPARGAGTSSWRRLRPSTRESFWRSTADCSRGAPHAEIRSGHP